MNYTRSGSLTTRVKKLMNQFPPPSSPVALMAAKRNPNRVKVAAWKERGHWKNYVQVGVNTTVAFK
jgi:hypothetical protein